MTPFTPVPDTFYPIRRTVYDDGLYEDVTQGISLGCPLSPLVGALFLDALDRRMEATGLCYVRFMDDWVVLAPTRWKLRGAVRVVNQTLSELKVQPHPDKTFVGWITAGFEFLGYRFSAAGLVGVAKASGDRFVKRLSRLYEQGADELRIGQYVRRWWRWVRAGLGSVATCHALQPAIHLAFWIAAGPRPTHHRTRWPCPPARRLMVQGPP